MTKHDKASRLASDSAVAREPGPAAAAGESAGQPAAEAPPAQDPEPEIRDPLDHDGDGKKGGSAPPAARTHLVVLKDDAKRGLSHGEVIAAEDAAAKELLTAELVRNATPAEVELAQPRVRRFRG